MPGAHGPLHQTSGALPHGSGRAGMDGKRPADQKKHRHNAGKG